MSSVDVEPAAVSWDNAVRRGSGIRTAGEGLLIALRKERDKNDQLWSMLSRHYHEAECFIEDAKKAMGYV